MRVINGLKSLLIVLLFTSVLSGCQDTPSSSVDITDEHIEQALVAVNEYNNAQISGTTLSYEHTFDGITLETVYSTGDYRLDEWRITDSKTITFSVRVKDNPNNASIFVEHVHADVSISSTSPQLNGMTQDSMDNSYHGHSQDGFYINEYPYENIFAVEGFSKDIIEGWGFYTGDFGVSSLSSVRLTEENLFKNGTIGSNLTFVYNLIVSNGNSPYHIKTFADKITIPTSLYTRSQAEKKARADADANKAEKVKEESSSSESDT